MLIYKLTGMHDGAVLWVAPLTRWSANLTNASPFLQVQDTADYENGERDEPDHHKDCANDTSNCPIEMDKSID